MPRSEDRPPSNGHRETPRAELSAQAAQTSLAETTDPLVLSYIGIRRAIGISGLALPVALGPGGWLLGIPFQDNMSSYYYTPLRDVFVGTLCAIGIFLFCYRGHDAIENWTANFGCLSALGLALFPIDAGSEPPFQRTPIGYLHTLSGGVFFLTLAVYSLYHFPRPGDDEPAADVQAGRPSERHVRQRNLVYLASGLTILLSMVAMGAYLFLLPDDWRAACDRWNLLFWMEWVAVWAFASAWLTKGRAIGSEIALGLLAAVEEQVAPLVRLPGGRGTPRGERD